MKRLLIITSLVVAGIFNLSAQETQIDLSKYKLPDMKRQTLEFQFDLANAFNKYHYPIGSMHETESQNSLNANITAIYGYYRNSSNWQQQLSAGIYLSGDYIDNKNDEEFAGENHYSANSIGLNSINRYYLDKLFLGVNPYLTAYYSYQNDMAARYRDAYMQIYVPLEVGYGRIERVEDARQAAYIYNELLKVKRANPGKSEEDLLRLAEKISQLKNERFFDSRKKRIYELEELDKYLKEAGFIDENDITYFATLSDMWSYGGARVRESGFRTAFFVNPGYGISDTHITDPWNYNYKAYVLKTGIKLNYEKPIDMYWQYGANADLYYGLSRSRSTAILDGNGYYPGVNFAIDNSIGYYPNTRTNINFNAGLELAKYFKKDNPEENLTSLKGKSLFAFAGINAYYYFTPQFRLSGAISGRYAVNTTKGGYSNVDYYSSDYYYMNNPYSIPSYTNRFFYGLELKFEYFLF